ncbi:Cytochrome c, mono-and diheme variants [Roseivivax halotolerans]|jgi:mono/diheme cytochrome c family protein|uniref:Cytochrome c, mono-and diheme variants n=1 Tax=Roseivivax halotolerans TaxID=93684 RepID=A0A1I6AQQ1_9RHOB|nr:cytochrome c [Roseivivax halotolerans]SFQ70972.1 Cytochrome c, mono-and diheme variants [Roseivivax halotolerans]
MNRGLWITASGAVLLGAALLATVTLRAGEERIVLRDTDPDTVALGAAVYVEHCAACHGANLEGQPDWRSPGPDGRLPAPPHDETGHTWHHDGETLFRLTKFGIGALIDDPDYASNMPVYDGVLTDEEIVAVLSYIKSTWPEDIRARHDDMESR